MPAYAGLRVCFAPSEHLDDTCERHPERNRQKLSRSATRARDLVSRREIAHFIGGWLPARHNRQADSGRQPTARRVI